MKIIVMLLTGICVLTACKKGATGKICTNEYRSFNVKLRSASQEAVELDTFYTRIVATNTTFHANDVTPHLGEGYYNVIGDNQQLLLPEGKNTDLRFIGVKNDQIIVNEPYVFKNNGCHIEKVSGKNEVIVP